MKIKHIEHMLIRTADIEATKQFYVDILGFEVGYRPAFPFDGYWLYQGDQAMIHLVPYGEHDAGQAGYLNNQGLDITQGTGPIDHIALYAEDVKNTRKELDAKGIQYTYRVVPEEDNLDQLFFFDPNGIKIELNFRA